MLRITLLILAGASAVSPQAATQSGGTVGPQGPPPLNLKAMPPPGDPNAPRPMPPEYFMGQKRIEHVYSEAAARRQAVEMFLERMAGYEDLANECAKKGDQFGVQDWRDGAYKRELMLSPEEAEKVHAIVVHYMETRDALKKRNEAIFAKQHAEEDPILKEALRTGASLPRDFGNPNLDPEFRKAKKERNSSIADHFEQIRQVVPEGKFNTFIETAIQNFIRTTGGIGMVPANQPADEIQ